MTEKVAVYSEMGYMGDLPILNIGRKFHACTSYMSEGTRV